MRKLNWSLFSLFISVFTIPGVSGISNTVDTPNYSKFDSEEESNLKERIASGETFYILFDCFDSVKNIIGNLRICEDHGPYSGYWRGEGIELTGYNRRYKKIKNFYYKYPSYHKGGRNLSLWGFKAYFDENGSLYQQGTHKKIGRIWVN